MGTPLQYKALLTLKERADEEMSELEQANFKQEILHSWTSKEISAEFDRLNRKLPATPHQMVKIGELEAQLYGVQLTAGYLISYFDADKKIKNMILLTHKKQRLEKHAQDPMDYESLARHYEFMAETMREIAQQTPEQQQTAQELLRDEWWIDSDEISSR